MKKKIKREVKRNLGPNFISLTIRQEKSFKALKKIFTTESILSAPDLDKKMRMKVDASYYMTREVLSIECEDGRWRPVAYLSKSLNKTK